MQATGLHGASLFPLIMRQRQMASSLVAALRGWNETGLLEELFWEDLGCVPAIGEQQFDNGGANGQPREDGVQNLEAAAFDYDVDGLVDLEALEAADTKYAKFREFLLQGLRQDPSEKFVVFAFFRPTLQYLARRLESDGVRAALIMGGMGPTTDDILREFSRPEGPSVLLSSEIGSEGIDLQFCRFVVNYDLPWNPMRVEQADRQAGPARPDRRAYNDREPCRRRHDRGPDPGAPLQAHRLVPGKHWRSRGNPRRHDGAAHAGAVEFRI